MTSLFQWICGRCSETLFDEYYFNIQPSQTSLCRAGQEYAAGSGSECWHYFYCLSETFCEVLKPRCVFHHQEETDPDKHNNSVWLTLFISTKCCLSCSFSHQVLKAFYCSRAAFKDNSHLPFFSSEVISFKLWKAKSTRVSDLFSQTQQRLKKHF